MVLPLPWPPQGKNAGKAVKQANLEIHYLILTDNGYTKTGATIAVKNILGWRRVSI